MRAGGAVCAYMSEGWVGGDARAGGRGARVRTVHEQGGACGGGGLRGGGGAGQGHLIQDAAPIKARNFKAKIARQRSIPRS